MKNYLKQYFIIFSGLVLAAIAISVFYLPNKIVSGGVSGLSTVLYYVFSIPVGLTYAVVNLALLACGIRFLGKQFVIKTVICSGTLSALVQLFSYIPPITDNVFLAMVFGSLLYGFGIGFTLIYGASTGGTDILSRLIQHWFAHIKIGNILLAVDAIVIGFSLVIFKQVDLALYGIIALFISTFSINWLIRRLNVSKIAFVITDNGDAMAKMLVSTSPRGVTVINAQGAYTNTEKKVLMCALKESEIAAFDKKVLNLDKNAFIIFSESQQIVGNGFHVYR